MHSHLSWGARRAIATANGTYPAHDRDGKLLPRTYLADVKMLWDYWNPEATRALQAARDKESGAVNVDTYTIASIQTDAAKFDRIVWDVMLRRGVEAGIRGELTQATADGFWWALHALALRLDAAQVAPSATERDWESWSEALEEAPKVIGKAVKAVAKGAGEVAGEVAGAAAAGLSEGAIRGLLVGGGLVGVVIILFGGVWLYKKGAKVLK